jgi:hypothetical protein
MEKKEDLNYDSDFTGAYPRYTGAISAVTEGPPEDMNEMPASENPGRGTPVYDGSDLKQHAPKS